MKTIGLFGGTFDPVHNGHVQMAVEAKAHLVLDEVRFIPCHQPPHRGQPSANSEQRLAMLSLALKGHEGLIVDNRECQRDQLSYTVETLRSCREQWGDAVRLVLLIGADAFAHLDTWHQWEQLRELAHVAVMARPNSLIATHPLLQQWQVDACQRAEEYHRTEEYIELGVLPPQRLSQKPAGDLVWLSMSLVNISATHIRKQFYYHQVAVDIAPDVANYIATHHLYIE